MHQHLSSRFRQIIQLNLRRDAPIPAIAKDIGMQYPAILSGSFSPAEQAVAFHASFRWFSGLFFLSDQHLIFDTSLNVKIQIDIETEFGTDMIE